MKNAGFTLIELLIVIAVIGALSSVVFNATNSARAKARDAQRVANVKQIERALFLYHSDHGSYPVSVGSGWTGNPTGWGGYSDLGENGYIPNLAPTYISTLPVDPKQDADRGYIYKSNGTDYFFLAYKTLEKLVTPDIFKRPSNLASNDLAVYTAGFTNEVVPGESLLTSGGVGGDGGSGGELAGGGGDVVVPEGQPPKPPTVDLGSGSYPEFGFLTFYAEDGASIYYVSDSSSYRDYDFEEMLEGSTRYTETITLTAGDYYFEIIAEKDGLFSDVLRRSYTITTQ